MATNNAINANSTTPLAVVNGGTGVNAVTTAPAATAFAGWDSNKNLSANNFISGYTSTATASGITTLTVASTYQQFFTGTLAQAVLMPVTSTLVLGQSWLIINDSTGVVTVQASGGGTITALAAGTSAVFTCILTSGTTAASWNSTYAEIETPVVVSQGGTGDTSFTAYAPICGGTTTTGALQSIASVGTSKQALMSNGAGALPTFQNISSSFTAPTVQKFVSGSGTYTTPTSPSPLFINVIMVGGGAGGNGSGGSPGAATGGGNTTFGTSLLVANGGAISSGAGGTGSLGSGPIGFVATGSQGQTATAFVLGSGGSGGNSVLVGGGPGGLGGSTPSGGFNAATNSGSGGGGGGGGSSGGGVAGGSAGGYVNAIINSPSSTYSYAIGASGAGGTAGSSGAAGGNGGAGAIYVFEYYQ